MSQARDHIAALLARLPQEGELSPDQQATLASIREKIETTADIQQELKNLFKVKNFSEFALSLMWVVERSENNASSPEEETTVLTLFRNAVADSATQVGAQAAEGEFFGAPPSSDLAVEIPVLDELPQGMEAEQQVEPEPPQEHQDVEGVSEPAVEGTSMPVEDHIKKFGLMLETFSTAVQSGADDRTSLLEQIVNENNVVGATAGFPEEYKQYCRYLTDFLQYIFANQFLDDVRVMNIVTNIQDPFATWAAAPSEAREGVLGPGIEILRDFKTMFE